MPYTWSVIAYSVYLDESSELTKTITDPTIENRFTVNNGTYITNSTRKFQFSYTISHFNTNYSISGGSLITLNSTSASGTIITSTLSNTNTQTNFTIKMEDNLGFVKTVNKTINVSNPSIDSFGPFVNSGITVLRYCIGY